MLYFTTSSTPCSHGSVISVVLCSGSPLAKCASCLAGVFLGCRSIAGIGAYATGHNRHWAANKSHPQTRFTSYPAGYYSSGRDRPLSRTHQAPWELILHLDLPTTRQSFHDDATGSFECVIAMPRGSKGLVESVRGLVHSRFEASHGRRSGIAGGERFRLKRTRIEKVQFLAELDTRSGDNHGLQQL
jgi:hypothetical protein